MGIRPWFLLFATLCMGIFAEEQPREISPSGVPIYSANEPKPAGINYEVRDPENLRLNVWSDVTTEGAGAPATAKNRTSDHSAPQVNDSTFRAKVSGEVALVDFNAHWCGPCRRMSPVIDDLYEQMLGKAVVVKVDVDESLQTASDYRVHSIPCLIIMINGAEVERHYGVHSSDEMKDWLAPFLEAKQPKLEEKVAPIGDTKLPEVVTPQPRVLELDTLARISANADDAADILQEISKIRRAQGPDSYDTDGVPIYAEGREVPQGIIFRHSPLTISEAVRVPTSTIVEEPVVVAKAKVLDSSDPTVPDMIDVDGVPVYSSAGKTPPDGIWWRRTPLVVTRAIRVPAGTGPPEVTKEITTTTTIVTESASCNTGH